MNDVTVLRDPVLDEEVHRKVFPSGLTAYVVRKPQFTKSYATIATRFGSIDTALPGDEHPLPDGIAHFLEHKIFEMPEGGDAFDVFAARGASANAFTSFSSTRYLFGTSTEYAANLRTLLDLVFDLHVTPGNVDKEKGIIGQEIAMYDDDPDWRIYFGALAAMYHRHPVRIDIAGTKKSIGAITADLLETVHRTYYHPSIMALAAVTPERVGVTFDAIEERVEGRVFGPRPGPRRVDVDEPRECRRATVRARLPVARPRLLVAFKDAAPRRGGRTQLRQEIATAIVLDCLFGNSGSILLKLYEEGLVDENFSCSYSAEPSYAFALVGGECDDVGKLRRALRRELDGALERGVGADEFERVRNKELGHYARAFNSPDRIAHMLVGHHLRGTSIADYRELLLAIRRPEVNRRLRALFDPAGRTCSIVEPSPQAGAASAR